MAKDRMDVLELLRKEAPDALTQTSTSCARGCGC